MTLLRIFSLLVISSAAWAQQPSAPSVPVPKAPAAWRIDYDGVPRGGGGNIKSEEFHVDARAAEKTTTYQDGSTARSLLVDHYKLYFDPQAKRIFVLDLSPGKGEFAQQLFHRQYPGFEWASPESFIGMQKVDGQECAAFREPENSENPSAPRREAYLLLANGQPFLIREGKVSGRYAFLNDIRSVEIPKDFQEVLTHLAAPKRPPGQQRSIAK